MECAEWREALRQRLGAEESAREERQIPRPFAEHARQCADCAARLCATRMLLRDRGPTTVPPSWLVGRISARIATGEADLPLKRRRSEPVRAPVALRRMALPFASALLSAAAMFVLMVFVGPVRMQRDTVTVRLVLQAPQAAAVSVVGDWNEWRPAANRLADPDGDGVWEGEIRLHRGSEYRYQFLIDGDTWIADPQAPLRVEDGFGGESSLLQL